MVAAGLIASSLKSESLHGCMHPVAGAQNGYTFMEMAFSLTLLYVAIALLSPGVFPVEISNLHIQEVLGALTILACALEVGGSGLSKRVETYFMLGLVAAAFLSILASGWMGGAVYFTIAFFPVVAPFFFIVISCRSLKRLKILSLVMLAVAFYIIFQGVSAQLTGNADSPYLLCEYCSQTGIVTPLYRTMGLGVLNDPNDLAQFLVALLPFPWLRWEKGSYLANLFLTILPACVLLTGVYFTHSRGGTLAVGVVILFGFKEKLGLIGSSILAGAGGIGALALGITGGRGISEDDGDRMGLWRDAFIAFKSHPLFGVGATKFPDYNNSLTAHNSYLLSLAETGLVGYFFWMGLLVIGWDGLGRHLRSKTRDLNRKLLSVRRRQEDLVARPNPTGRMKLTDLPLLQQSWLPTSDATFGSHEGGITESVGGSQPLGRPGLQLTQSRASNDHGREEYVARLLRISLVGFMAAAFFISRTYSMDLYILLGMATALRGLDPLTSNDTLPPKLMRKLCFVTVLSIVLLYILIRFGH